MEKLKIKNESQIKKCEICHQSDLFNETESYCSRCNHSSLEGGATSGNLQRIEIKTELEFKDLVKSHYWYSYIYRKVNLSISLILGIGIILIVGNFYLNGHLSKILSILLYGCIGGLMNIPYSYLVLNKRFSNLTDQQRKVTYIFDNEGINVNTTKSQAPLTWEAVVKVIETKAYFYIFVSNKNFITIPKRFLLTNKEVVGIKEMLHHYLGSKLELRER